MSAPTLKDQLLALCDEHGLNYVAIHVYTRDDGEHFIGGSAHAGGKVGHAHGDDPTDCIARAIDDLNSKRYISPVIAELVAA